MFNNTRYLKNTLTVLLLALFTLSSSCSKKDDAANTLEFDLTSYSIPVSGEVVMKIVTTAPVATETKVPFTLGGNAVKGTDYELSADVFVIPAGGKIGEVKVTAKASFDYQKKIKVNLGTIPPGIQAGNLLFTEISIEPTDILLYSFESQKLILMESAEVNLNLTAAAGSFVAQQELRIPVVVAEGSTAVEGVHFAFDGPKEFIVPAGKTKGVLKIKFLKQQAGKDLVILKVAPTSSHYIAGNFNSTKMTIFGSSFNKLKGTWKFKAFTNRQWMIDNIYGMDDEAAFPKNTAKDLITINEDGVLSTEMTGDLKNYFRTSTLSNLGEVTEVLQEAPGFPPPRVKIQLVQLSAINVNFSAVKQKIRSGQIGFRVFTEGGKDILEVTLRDYEPTDFLVNTYEMYKEFGDVPAMKSMPLRFQFERVN